MIRMIFGVAALACLTITSAYGDQHVGPHGQPAAAQTKVHAVVPPTHGNPHTVSRPIGNPHTARKPTGNPHTTNTASTKVARVNVSVAQHITVHPQLASRLQPLLPPGMPLKSAAAGFKNRGQAIAALHVSHNLNIPFAQLKGEMTGADHESLGRAIQDLRPGINATVEARRAESEAREDLRLTKVKVDRDKDRDDRR